MAENDEKDDEEEDSLENNENFAKAMSPHANLQMKGESRTSKPPNDELCKYFNSGKCCHGFSWRKPHEDKDECPYFHPKICPKLFKFGLDRSKGCQGLKAGCNEYHPHLCKNHIKGQCEGNNCSEGFHLRSITNRNK